MHTMLVAMGESDEMCAYWWNDVKTEAVNSLKVTNVCTEVLKQAKQVSHMEKTYNSNELLKNMNKSPKLMVNFHDLACEKRCCLSVH